MDRPRNRPRPARNSADHSSRRFSDVRRRRTHSLLASLLPTALLLHEVGSLLARGNCRADAPLTAAVAVGVAIVLGTAWPLAPRISRVLLRAVAALIFPVWAGSRSEHRMTEQQRRVYSFQRGARSKAMPLACRLAGRSPPVFMA